MPPVATTTVNYEVNNPAAQAVANATVTARLSGGDGDRNDEGTVITSTLSTVTDANGAFSLALVPNSAYRAAGTSYVVQIAGGPNYHIVVPVSGTAVSLWDIRVDPTTLAPVPAATPPIYLQRSERGAVNGVASLGADGLVPTAQLPAGASTPDATATVKGILKLTNDLGGTADLPTVPGLAGKQPLDSDLTAIAALAPADGALIQRVSGAWASQTAAQVKTSLVLVKADVGLGNVDNTSDANKPVSTAQQTALDGKVDESLLDAKGDIFAATAADTPGRLPVGANGTMLLADTSQSTGLRWAARTAPAYNPEMDGLIAVTADPAIFRGGASPGSGFAARLLVPAGKVITGALACASSAGTVGAGGTNGFAINDDSGTLVTNTVDDNNLWAALGPRSKAFPSPIAAQTADRYLYVSLRVTGYSVGPGFDFIDGTSGGGRFDGLLGGKKRSILLGGTSWGSIDPAGGTSGSGYMPFLALY